jgi:hypothetical protein
MTVSIDIGTGTMAGIADVRISRHRIIGNIEFSKCKYNNRDLLFSGAALV